MEELKQLIGKLKENIQPDIAEKLLAGFDAMTPAIQERILNGLRSAVDQKHMIQDAAE